VNDPGAITFPDPAIALSQDLGIPIYSIYWYDKVGGAYEADFHALATSGYYSRYNGGDPIGTYAAMADWMNQVYGVSWPTTRVGSGNVDYRITVRYEVTGGTFFENTVTGTYSVP
jgi:hypothetical protein